MNIKAIRLRNFRGFQNARIELKPLTVLLGPNSAGKSAFGQALAAMAHVHKYYSSTPQASLTPPPNADIDTWPVDLGTTFDLRTSGEDGPVVIELETSGGVVKLGFGGLKHTSELLLSYIAYPSASGEQSAATNKIVETVPTGQTSAVVPLDDKFHSVRSTDGKSQFIELTKRNEVHWFEAETQASLVLDGLVVKAVQHDSGTQRVLSGVATSDLRLLLEKLTYLRANRKRPARGYGYGIGSQQAIGYSGEWTPSILLKDGANKITYKLPPAIPNNVDEAKRASHEWKEKHETLNHALCEWLSQLKLAKKVETLEESKVNPTVKVRVSLDGKSEHDITEIGFGVSQVIPILIAGLLQPVDSLLIVDLPEAHLHPRPQSEIADFFCSLIKSGRTTLVETHSEMFFHRLRLRAAMDPDLMKNIAIYFIDPQVDGICVNPRLVGLNFDDELAWPEGFLQEAWETESQISAIREALRLQRS